MHLKEYQRLQVGYFESKENVNSFGGILISTIIVGVALIIITIFASFALLGKYIIK